MNRKMAMAAAAMLLVSQLVVQGCAEKRAEQSDASSSSGNLSNALGAALVPDFERIFTGVKTFRDAHGRWPTDEREFAQYAEEQQLDVAFQFIEELRLKPRDDEALAIDFRCALGRADGQDGAPGAISGTMHGALHPDGSSRFRFEADDSATASQGFGTLMEDALP